MLKEAPRPPTEIGLSPPLEKLNRRGPRRAERRKRKPMASRGLAPREGLSRVQVAPRMQKHCTDWLSGGTGTGTPGSLHPRPEGVL
jgi:hypothetical protein